MVVTYNEEVLRLVVSQITQNVGWNGIGNQSLDILKEVCRKYIQEIGKVTSSVCNHYNRSEPSLDDLAIAFKQFDISLPELEDYYSNVEAVPFAKGPVPQIPVASARGCSRLIFTDQTETETRAEYYEEWLPTLRTAVDTVAVREGLESIALNETEEPASVELASKRAQGKREDAVKTAPSALKVSGFSELEATQPTSVYIASNGQIVGVNGREGRHPEAKLPPKDYDEEDLFDRVCGRYYEKQLNDAVDEQRVREKPIPSPLKLKLKDKKKLKKNKENSSAKSAADSKSKDLILKKIKKERKDKKEKKSFGSLSIKVSGLTSGTPTATPSPAMTKSPKSDEGNHEFPDQSFSLRNFIEDNHHKPVSINDISVDECISAVIARAAEEENEVGKKKEEKGEEKKKSKDKDKDKKKKVKKLKKKKGQLVEETIDDVIKGSMIKEEVPASKDIYNFNDDASNNSMNVVLKVNTPPQPNRSQDDDKEAAKILVSLSEEKKAKKSSPKKHSPGTSLNSPPKSDSPKQQNANSFQSSLSSSPFPKVSPGTTPLSPTGNLFNPFANLSTGTPISTVPTPPLFTKGEPIAYPKPPMLFKASAFSPANRSDSGFESSTNIYGHGGHHESCSSNSIPPKPPIKTLAEKKALPDITVPLILPKKERKDKRKKDKHLKEEKKDKVKKSKKLSVSEEYSDDEEKDGDVVPRLTVKISGGTSSATPSPSSTASSTKIVIHSGTPPISPGIEKEKKVDDKDKKDRKRRKNSLREKALVKSLGDAASCTVITETISTETGENGGKLWICPACKTPDDGTPMIGCDECDDWYHWVCVGIKVPPKDEDSWFCDRCIAKQQQIVHKLEHKKNKDKRIKDKRQLDHEDDDIDDESVKTPTLLPKVLKPKTSTGKSRGRPPKHPPLIPRVVEESQEERIWLCPQCNVEDDGSPMIGCDGCDEWYHWMCVGIVVKPKAEEVWLCPRCKKKKKTPTASKAK